MNLDKALDKAINKDLLSVIDPESVSCVTYNDTKSKILNVVNLDDYRKTTPNSRFFPFVFSIDQNDEIVRMDLPDTEKMEDYINVFNQAETPAVFVIIEIRNLCRVPLINRHIIKSKGFCI